MDFGAALPIGRKSLLTYLTEVTKPYVPLNCRSPLWRMMSKEPVK
jgi:hypothetical protein